MEKFKKAISLMLVFTFAAYPVAFSTPASAAEPAVLDDAQLDEIAAGEWVLAKKNTITIDAESQANITAVSTSNTVDSANAVQSNIINQNEGQVEITQSNEATVANDQNVDQPASTSVLTSKTTLEVNYTDKSSSSSESSLDEKNIVGSSTTTEASASSSADQSESATTTTADVETHDATYLHP